MSFPLQAAILEQNESHTELIPSQVKYLRKYDVVVYLMVNEYAYAKIDPEIIAACQEVYVFKRKNTFLDDLRIGREIATFLRKSSIKNLILNTASGKFLRNLLINIPSSIYITGIIHNIGKVEKSFTQKYTNFRVSKYLKLGDHLKSRNELNSFYPLLESVKELISTEENPGEIKLMIPGNIEQKRRDYEGLINLVHKHSSQLNNKLKFILAGNISKGDGEKIIKMIKDYELESQFEIFKGYIESSTFDKIAMQAHYILPLIHPNIQDFNKYYDQKISGSFNIAYSFRKPLLMHDEFSQIEEFTKVSIFYNEDNFIDIINNLSPKPDEIIRHYANNPKYDFHHQAEVYFKNVIKKGI